MSINICDHTWHSGMLTLPAQAGAVLFGLCQRSDKAQTEQHSGGPASLLASVAGIVICGGHVTLPAVCVGVARTKSADQGFTVWIAVSRAAESEWEEGVDLVHNLPLVPRCCLAIVPLALSLSLPRWWCIATSTLSS